MGDDADRSDASGPNEDASDEGVEAALAELRASISAQNRERAVRLAHASRLVFALGVVMSVILVLVWVMGALTTSEAGFRILALAVGVLFGLAFLTGALSAAVARRS